MADTKISGLAQLTGAGAVADADELVIVDKSDATMAASGTDKRLTVADLAKAISEGGRLNLADQSPPSAPASGLTIYTRPRAGRRFVEMMGPSGLDTSLQPALFGNNVVLWLPGTGTTASIAFGKSWTVGATQAHPALATTNLLTSMSRATFTTSTTSGNASGVRMSASQFWRGNAAGLGGFFFFARFGVVTFQSAMQIWCGLSATTGILAGEPSAQNNTVCIGKDTADVNWQLMFRSASAVTKVDLGLAVAANQVLDVMFFAPPNGANITARVVDITSPASPVVLADNTVHTANLPVSTAFLVAHAESRTNAASAVAIALNRIYVESDY